MSTDQDHAAMLRERSLSFWTWAQRKEVSLITCGHSHAQACLCGVDQNLSMLQVSNLATQNEDYPEALVRMTSLIKVACVIMP